MYFVVSSLIWNYIFCLIRVSASVGNLVYNMSPYYREIGLYVRSERLQTPEV